MTDRLATRALQSQPDGAHRPRRAVSLVIFDLDNFKAVVDGYGTRRLPYDRPDRRTVARLIRPGDVAARFGGDEFVIVLPHRRRAALRIAEAIRDAVASTRSSKASRRSFRRDRQRRRRQLSRAAATRESLPAADTDVLREALGKEPRRARGKGGLAFRDGAA